MPELLVVASAKSGTVDLIKETVAASAERMSLAHEELAFWQPALDFHKRTSLFTEAVEAAGTNQYGLREGHVDPHVVLVPQSTPEGLRPCR